MRQVVRRVVCVVGLVALLVAGLGLVPAQVVRAAGTVTNCNDSGPGSLRDTIVGGFTVTFTPGLNCSSTGLGPIRLTSGQISIFSDKMIDATGATIVVDGGCTANCGTASATGGGSVFWVYGGSRVGLTGLTIQHGVGGSGGGHDGGGISILDGGTVMLTNCTLTGNAAPNGGVGGGIVNNGGTLTVTNSTVSGNTASSGGGIYNNGTLTVTNSTLSGNSAATGGGIFNISIGGTLTLASSTLSGNSATSEGGGIFNHRTLTLTNSTLSGNSAGAGGGIYNEDILTLTNSTLSGNSAATGGGILNTGILTVTNCTFSGNSANSGGGIYNVSATVTLTNTLVANSPSGGDLAASSGTFTGSANLIDDATISNLTGTGNVNQPALLGALGNYGGATQTVRLLAGSPALAHGDPTVCASTSGTAPVAGLDQRGLPRPATVCAIGAYEPQPFAITASAGSGQSASVGTAFATNLQARVTDNQTNPLPGYSVIFTTSAQTGPSGIFAFFPPIVTTDGSGVATAPAFTANSHAGTYNVTANLTTTPLATPASFSLTNLPGAATTLTVTGYPAPVVSGTAHPFTVTAFDQFGNTATGYTGTVHFTSTDTLATLPADYPFVAGDAGVHSVSATLVGAGTWSLTATDTTTASITGTQGGIVVTAAPLVSIAVTPANGPVKVGAMAQYTATGTYADGTTADLTSVVTWSSDGTTVARVDASGKVLGLSPGSAHVTATQGSMSGQTSVTVSAGTPVGIAPAPAPVSRPGGASVPPAPGAAPAPAPTGR